MVPGHMLALLTFTPDCNRIASIEATSLRGVCGTPLANACTVREWFHLTIRAHRAIGSTLRALKVSVLRRPPAKQSSIHATLAQHVLAQHEPHPKPAHCSALQP
jgi:hypothetical protein